MEEPRFDRLGPIPLWYVAFVDYGENIWWHRFLRPGFRHCFAFTYDPRSDAWIVCDPTVDGFFLRALPFDQLAPTIRGAQIHGRILKVRTVGERIARPRVFATCVTVIGHLIGLRRCAFSPFGLYRTLLRYGAEPAFLESADDG